MSEQLFGEATVHLTPDLTGFVTELKKEVKAAVERVEKTPAAKIRISPALTRDFVGNLRKQVNLAVAQAQKGVKPIQIRAVLTDTSRAAIAREIRTGAQTVRTTSRAAAPARGAATTGVAPASRDAVTALVGEARAEKLLAEAERARIPILTKLTSGQLASNKTTVDGARGHLSAVSALDAEAAASAQLSQARLELAAAGKLDAGTAAFTKRVRAADTAALNVLVEAERAGSKATIAAAQAFRDQIRTLPGATAALDETSRAAKQAASNMSQLRRGVLSTSLSFLGIRGATLAASARFLAGAAAIAVFAKALQSAAQFAQQLSVFQATTGATGEELDRVRETARALGADIKLPGVTAQDAAEAMTELAKAGLSVQDALAGARGVLQLATAAAIDNAQATELAANAINAFGLAGRDATHVADVFANAANAAQGSIVDIGIAFQQSAAAGRQVGLTFEDTSEFLTVLARNGLKGSDAGTSLRTALIRLIKPTKEAAGELKRLGVETRDAAGNLRPDVFIQLAEATRGMAPAQRDATLALIGGQDAFRAITILGRQSIADFIRLRRELRQQGTAADLAKARMTGLRGAVEGLSNTLSTAGIRAGQSLTPGLQGVVEGLTGVTVAMTQSENVTGIFQGSVDALSISFSALGQTIGALSPVLGPIASTLGSITNAIGVPTILSAVVAYKGLGLAMRGIDAARTGPIAVAFEKLALQMSLLKLELASGGVVGGMRAFGTAMSAAAFSALGMTLAITAAAAAIFFLVTRETAAEKATRKLKEATEGLITAQEKLNASAVTRRDTGLAVNSARLNAFEAERAALTARAALANSNAAKGTFARTKLELQLAVALDNVKVAQNSVTDAVTAARQAREENLQAARNEKKARDETIAAITREVAVESALARVHGKGGLAAQRVQERQAIKDITADLQKRIEAAQQENTVESRALAERLQLLTGISTLVQKIPSKKAIEIAINAPNTKAATDQLITEFGVAGTKAEAALRQALTGQLGAKLAAAFNTLAHSLDSIVKPPFQSVGDNALGAFVGGFNLRVPSAADEMAKNLISAFAGAMKRTENQAAGASIQENLAVIASGATGATLPALQTQLAIQQKAQRDAETQIAALTKAGSKTGLGTARKARAAAIAAQAQIITQIRGINETLASDAKGAADDAKAKQDEIFENILKAMGIRRDARQQAIEDAALTEGSGDDLSANRALRRLINVQIANLQQRIRNARKEGLDVTNLIAGLRVLEGLYRDLGRTVRELQATRRQEIQDRIAESNALDIANAQITGNRNAEIRARNREIARLKALQAKTKAGTIEYKRLRNLINEQIAAVEELRKKQGDKNTALLALQKQEFEFLQRIQGFTGNLLGNLIPGGIGGLVGGQVGPPTAPVGASVGLPPGVQPGGGVIGGFNAKQGAAIADKFKTAADAGRERGFSAGQGNTTNNLLRKILHELHRQNRGSEHPEAKHQRKETTAMFDYGVQGGTHGM